ncbi:ABC-type spermidine/putrescine transport systems ATPase component [Rubrobacter radiotolerans]|uniref:ABC transporter ATP-binding protein n=1 Tax=Rubrobacter radiotolerans TaxID=42256 RepID=A0A023X508_RUBRA|nr:ABC transporter ATP-binding protein [Rubrobacter radiotolerans]AHY47316.1 ABC-type spermidine/putrescine transport systems ATPase component [Rubrobacter radiotolerans]MDX5894720.1 ABC transporter ATP-binding protein [Rubrobacter radiotolerans]SMC06606.1 putative spermidine/putrescine transport system ATP-binding protein [Rubrobacter radiotolerans DSM 5868]
MYGQREHTIGNVPASSSLELLDLSHRYGRGDEWAIRGLTLGLRPGELAALLGPSGCGKTTVLKIVAGLLRPTGGDVLLDGVSIVGMPPERRGIAMVFQKPLLFPHMTVDANVGFGLRMRGISRREVSENVRTALARVQMAGFADRKPDELSGGQQQRVALARVLVTGPRLLLLDEPFSNLDAGLREEMRDLVKDLQGRYGYTTLFVTHDQTEAVVMADRIALLFDGRLQMHDSPKAFYERPASRRVARFFGATNFIPGRAKNGTVATSLGRLRPVRPAPPGDVTLTIRPEAVRLGPGENQFSARITRVTYLGTRVVCDLRAGDVRLRIELPPQTKLREGESIVAHLPAEALWSLED